MFQMRYDPEAKDPEKGFGSWHEDHAGLVAVPEPAEPREPAYHRRNASPDREKRTKTDRHPDVHLEQATYVTMYEGRDEHLRNRKAGWPIGSGPAESYCRHVVQERCKFSGMHKSPVDLRNVLAFRSAILNERFDSLWAHHARVTRWRKAA